jgi:hypothetical protein
MTKRFRTILFYFLLVLFVLIAPLVILYSQGYRFDLETKKITQTGAFYFKVLPKSAEVYIGEKLKKKTDFLFGTAFIDNLLPKKYAIKIEKDGYYPWQKSLEVQEKTVTEAKNIVLIPKNPNFEILTKETEDFFFSPDEKKIILKETNEDGWSLKLYELERKIKSHLIDEKDIIKELQKDNAISTSPKNALLLDIKWSQDSKRVLLTLGIKQKIKHFILETTEKSNLMSLDFLGGDIKNISFSPQKDLEIFFIKNNSLFKADFIKKEVSGPILNNLISYQFLNSDLIWLNNKGFLFKSDSRGEKIEVLNLKPIDIESENEFKISAHDLSKILLQKSNTLFYLDQDSRTFKEISNSVKNFRFSPDFKKVVYWNNYEIWILFLEEKLDQPPKGAGELLFLTRFSEKIEEAFWYTSHYLIFNAGDKIKIVEIDDRDKINTVDLTSFEKPKIFWNKIYKNLYILINGNLFSSEKLIP